MFSVKGQTIDTYGLVGHVWPVTFFFNSLKSSKPLFSLGAIQSWLWTIRRSQLPERDHRRSKDGAAGATEGPPRQWAHWGTAQRCEKLALVELNASTPCGAQDGLGKRGEADVTGKIRVVCT